jgi:hypothetical protein
MKRSGPLKRKTPLAASGKSDTATYKKEIQRLLREIVIVRDGGCILRPVRHCNGVPGVAVLQADHLITRANSATYADPRLVVCVCQPCHYWKSVRSDNKAHYDHLVRMLLPQDRLTLWERCEKESWRPKRTSAMDWRLHIVTLEQELRASQ